MRTIIFDTETTGLPLPLVAPLEKQPKIIELGMLVVEGEELVQGLNWLIHPGEEITAEITKITGITNEDLVGKPRFSEIADEVEKLFASADACIAHNAPFDTKLVNFEFRRMERELKWPDQVICTVQEYTHITGKRPKLTFLYEHIMGKPLEQTHRASDDALALFELLKADGFLKMIGTPR
jgi:DNA polymerase III epsilon subunit family exonuclease